MKTATKPSKRVDVPLHPSLLRGQERLRYMQQFRGAITPARAKILLKEMARARKSFDRTIIKK